MMEDGIFGHLHKLSEAKALLDDLLKHYNKSTKQFESINAVPNQPSKLLLEALGRDAYDKKYQSHWHSEADSLNERIKEYLTSNENK